MKKYFMISVCIISIHIMGQNIPIELLPDSIDYETCYIPSAAARLHRVACMK